MSQKTKILVVEDNDFVRMQIVKFLEGADHDVVETTDGKAALEEIGSGIDLAVVDVRMEPMNGLEFMKAMRGREIEIPTIFVTGDQNPDLLSDASALGVAAILMKPVEKDRLLKAVSRTLQAAVRVS